jgi:penicillin-binding protein 1A
MTKNTYVFGCIALIFAVICGSIAGMVLSLIRDLPQIRSLETFTPSAITRIYSSDNVLLAELYKEKRDPVPLRQIPDYLKKALIITEDRQFYSHCGIDIKGIARAVITDIMAGKFVQGASTISQQLSKTLFLTPDKTLKRKLKEAFLALQLERRYTKDEILELYLNQIYLGSGAYGVASAAKIFFGKPVTDLQLSECAMIAAMPKAPSRFSPLVNPELALKRRNIVLKQMVNAGIINSGKYRAAVAVPFIPAENKTKNKAPYFVDYIKNILENQFGAARLYRGGLTILTTLSARMQEISDRSIAHGISALKARRAKNNILAPDPQGALIAIDVKTGGIIAMSGGTDYGKSHFNRATTALRQPGSAFKPIVYAHAVEQGFNQAMRILDAPIAFQGASKKKEWRPENFSKTYQGEITLRHALTHSKNIPAVRLIEKLGTSSVIDFARKLGIQSRLAPDLSLALGTSELRLMELTASYAIFANKGIYIRPHGIVQIRDADQRIIWQPSIEKRPAISRDSAAIITNILEGVILEGTAKKAKMIHRPVAGKTGTTNMYKDALFVGFSPSVACGVWAGCDDFSTLGPLETGARTALPVWIEFMDNALSRTDYEYFDIPDNVVKVRINPKTGKPVSDGGGVDALFRKNNAPK